MVTRMNLQMPSVLPIVFSLLLPLTAKAATNASKYKVDGVPTLTVSEFLGRAKLAWPETSTSATESDSIVHKGERASGLIVQTTGTMRARVVRQTLSYVRLHESVFQLALVSAQICKPGQVIRNGEWQTVEICEDSFAPVAKEFMELTLLADGPIDLANLSTRWGKSVQPNSDPIHSQQRGPTVITRADMQAIMAQRNFTWQVSTGEWRGYDGKSNAVPLILFTVTGRTARGRALTQTFGYAQEQGGPLKLKTIQGSSCAYNDRIQKNLCEEAWVPSGDAPFPNVLIDSIDRTVSADFNPLKPTTGDISVNEGTVRPKSACGLLQTHFAMALRMHFEKGSLKTLDLQEYKNASQRLARAIDPEGLFLKHRLQPVLNEEGWKTLLAQLGLGSQGDCQVIQKWVSAYHADLLVKSASLQRLLRGEAATDDWQKAIQARIESVAQGLRPIYKSTAAQDIARGRMKEYFQQALRRTMSFEESMLRAMTRLDAYSDLLDAPPASVAESSSAEKLFGISIDYGNKHRYLSDVHPRVAREYGLTPGLRVLLIRQKNADELSPAAFDRELLQSDKPLELVLQGERGSLRVVLASQPLSVAEAMFKIVGHPTDSATATSLEIQIRTFVPGLADLMASQLKAKLATHRQVQSFVLNLENNPGGNVDEAYKVASVFVRDTTVGYHRLGPRSLLGANEIRSDSDYFVDDKRPLFILVNGGTRSSSEILAAALQDLGRGVVVGRPTFGKFVGQSFVPAQLSDGRPMLLMVTSTEYFSPTGLSRNGKALQPDFLIPGVSQPQFRDGNRLGSNYLPPSHVNLRQYDHRSRFDKSDLLRSDLRWIAARTQKSSIETN